MRINPRANDRRVKANLHHCASQCIARSAGSGMRSVGRRFRCDARRKRAIVNADSLLLSSFISAPRPSNIHASKRIKLDPRRSNANLGAKGGMMCQGGEVKKTFSPSDKSLPTRNILVPLEPTSVHNYCNFNSININAIPNTEIKKDFKFSNVSLSPLPRMYFQFEETPLI